MSKSLMWMGVLVCIMAFVVYTGLVVTHGPADVDAVAAMLFYR